jgi:hypothetical protein
MGGHPERIHHELGVHLHVFQRLLVDLQKMGYSDSKHVLLEEQLAIFLYGCGTACLSAILVSDSSTPTRQFQSMLLFSLPFFWLISFQIFLRMLSAFSSAPFYTKYVPLPKAADPTPLEIANNPKFYPYFADVIGALDGTHIACTPSAVDRQNARNRKGFLSQNCLIACSFDLRFLYVLSGWEGSAADATVYSDARNVDFPIPVGKMYLADAGYAASDELLVPYRGVRYHLAEWQRASLR